MSILAHNIIGLRAADAGSVPLIFPEWQQVLDFCRKVKLAVPEEKKDA